MHPSRYIMVPLCIGIVWLMVAPTDTLVVVAEDRSGSRTGDIGVTFTQLDLNSDEALTRKEFLEQAAQRAVLQRDFTLFDFDGDNRLTRFEFAAVIGNASSPRRGAIPDPFDALVSRAVEAIDESYEHWNGRPDVSINSRHFLTNFMKSILAESSYAFSGRFLRQADPSGDGRVSRAEAMRFIEQQLGGHWGLLALRARNGNVLRLDRFLATDTDRDGLISRAEFDAGAETLHALDSDFETNDRNADGLIAFAEYASRDSPNWVDPVAWFRRADTNFDALIDPAEMALATTVDRRRLVASSFTGFDEDGDGKLSLQEYRLSMHANVNDAWHSIPQDDNQDNRISLEEFEFNQIDLFHLQRLYYFHRLDNDHDGFLSPAEFSFQ